ncbi:MAG: bifunctional metallophosphatase/5'-nucleotidase [Flavobacterium sp.]
MERRIFIKNATTGIISLGFASELMAMENNTTKKLTILHTNDVHSHIDPFPEDHPRNPGLGGAAKRAAWIQKIRQENDNVLLLDAGDSFQGTPYFNYYGGELEFKLMSMMGYDATTIGNHEFDNGIEGLAAQVPNANFTFITSNYDFKNTIMNGLTSPYKIFLKDGLRIGVFGLGIELNGLVEKKMYNETKYLDPVETAQEITKVLKREKCDLIICLSHLGYAYRNEPAKISDMLLAEKTKDIDLIIGGHTHTFLEKPTLIKNLEQKEVLVNQAGCFGIYLGKIDFIFEKKAIKENTSRIITL